ncbi:MAG TPA: SgcJ/EcaC family oxidoreductase [Stenomitos sp.]
MRSFSSRLLIRFGVTVLSIVALLSSILLCNLALVTAAPLASSQSSLRPNEMRSLIEQAKDAWVAGNGAAFAQLFVEDGELIVPGQRWQGRAVIQRESDRFNQDFSVTIEIQSILIEGNHAAVAWNWCETPKKVSLGSSVPVRQAQDAIFVDFEAGGIRRWREYIDNETPQHWPHFCP